VEEELEKGVYQRQQRGLREVTWHRRVHREVWKGGCGRDHGQSRAFSAGENGSVGRTGIVEVRARSGQIASASRCVVRCLPWMQFLGVKQLLLGRLKA
jgi:hypothetical protein